MSRQFVTLGLSFLLALSASYSHAAEMGKGGEKEGAKGAAREISLDELKQRCQDYTAFSDQIQVTNLTVQCSESANEWVAMEPGQIGLNSGRDVATRLVSSKLVVPASMRTYALEGSAGSCMRYKQVQKTLQIEKSITCAELLGQKDGSLDDLCASALDQTKGKAPKFVEIKDTGVTRDTCPADAVFGSAGKAGGKGKN